MSQTTSVLAAVSTPNTLSTGLADDYREEMADRLSDLLAGNYRMMIKNHVYHWNVVGPIFVSFHELTEKHYTHLFKAADELAERIRAIGHLAPVNSDKLKMFSNDDVIVNNAKTSEMLADLIDNHEMTVRKMREAAEMAGDAGDFVTEDMLTDFMAFYEQALWMLKAIATD